MIWSRRAPSAFSSPAGGQEADGQDRQETDKWMPTVRHSAAQRDPAGSMIRRRTTRQRESLRLRMFLVSNERGEESDSRILGALQHQIAGVSEMFGAEGRCVSANAWRVAGTHGRVWNCSW